MAAIKLQDWDWAGAEQEARRAIALNPQTDGSLVFLQMITGRRAESIASAEHRVKVDPLSSGAHYLHAIALYFARRYQEALAASKRALELEPRNIAALVSLGYCYEALAQPQEALAVFDRPELRESPYIAEVYARLGRRDDALRVLNGPAKREGPFPLEEMAAAYFALGDKERGFEWLTKAFDQRSASAAYLNVFPRFDGVRSDPRFKALIARLKLPN
jgi:tetratricopeptide (TPR) repeat protein